MSAPLWIPSPERVARARITAFARSVATRWGVEASTYDALYRFSIERPADFWRSVWEFCGVAGDMGERVVVDLEQMPGARFFPDARLNFAENLLRARDDGPAIVFQGEGLEPRTLTRAALHDQVALFAAALRAQGIGPGDRVAAYLPNLPEAIVAALATAAVGAVWSSCSPDFGVQGVLDRFGQIEPRILLTADGYHYGGRTHDSLGKAGDVARALPTVERVVVVPYVSGALSLERIAGAVLWDDFTAGQHGTPLTFARLPFNHPLYILCSSGTTGVPKCVQLVFLDVLHERAARAVDVARDRAGIRRPGDRVFYFTTLGWILRSEGFFRAQSVQDGSSVNDPCVPLPEDDGRHRWRRASSRLTRSSDSAERMNSSGNRTPSKRNGLRMRRPADRDHGTHPEYASVFMVVNGREV